MFLAEKKYQRRKKLGINFRGLKTTIFRENKLSRILKIRIFRGIKLSRGAKIAKVSSALLSSLKVYILRCLEFSAQIL